jgi:hypothetical protein
LIEDLIGGRNGRSRGEANGDNGGHRIRLRKIYNEEQPRGALPTAVGQKRRDFRSPRRVRPVAGAVSNGSNEGAARTGSAAFVR